MSNIPEVEVGVTEMRTLQKIQLEALKTAETVRQATGRDEFTTEEVEEIVVDKRSSGFNIQLGNIKVNIKVTKS